MNNGIAYREKHVAEMQQWSLDQKINHALKRIQEFHREVNGKIFIAFSGGKDSTVLLHLVRSLYPDTIAVFSNTTNEFIEILEFVTTVDNVVTLHPKMSFNETIRQFGFPLVSKKVAHSIRALRRPTDKNKNSRKLYLEGIKTDGTKTKSFKLAKKWHKLIDVEFEITSKCCDILKKEPMRSFEKESGLFPIIGTQISESTQRKMSWMQTGCNTFKGGVKSRPLSIWNEKDIWEYIHRFNIPYSSIYDDVTCPVIGDVIIEGEIRTGCAYCAFGAHLERGVNRFQRLALRKPKQYEKAMQLKNNGISFEDALNDIGVKTRIPNAK